MKPNTKAWRKARRRRLRQGAPLRISQWQSEVLKRLFEDQPLVVHISCDARPLLDALANLSAKLVILKQP